VSSSPSKQENFTNNTFYSTGDNAFGFHTIINPSTDTDMDQKIDLLAQQDGNEVEYQTTIDDFNIKHNDNVQIEPLNRNLDCNLGGDNIIHDEKPKVLAPTPEEAIKHDRLTESIDLINKDKEEEQEEEKGDADVSKLPDTIKDQILSNNLTEEEKNLIKNVINSYNELVKKGQLDTTFLISKEKNKLFELISLENGSIEKNHNYIISLSQSLIDGFVLNYKIEKTKHLNDKDLFRNYNIIIYYLNNVKNKYKEKAMASDEEVSNECRNLLNKKKILLNDFSLEEVDNIFKEYIKLKNINCKI